MPGRPRARARNIPSSSACHGIVSFPSRRPCICRIGGASRGGRDPMDDDLRLLRRTVANLEDALDRLEAEGVGGEACIVGKTVSQGAYPTTAARFYACTVQVVTGTESEG